MYYHSSNGYHERVDITERTQWTFLSNHGHALIFLAHHPNARLRDIADAVGITERFAHSLVSDLISAEYVKAERHGRRNEYRVDDTLSFRHPLERQAQISRLIEIFSPTAEGDTPTR